MSTAPATPLPKAPTQPDPGAFINPFNDSTLLTYYAAVRSFHGAIKFLGMGSVREKVTRDVHMDTLFVNPRLHERHVSASEAVAEPKLLNEAQPLLEAVQKHHRLVVLGDPGSGKSTIVQYLAEGLCRTLDSSVRNALGPLVPIPIILRELDLAALGERPDFDTLLQAWLHSTLRPVPAAFRDRRDLLDQLLGTGQVLVLIDGLDEVGDVPLRENLRTALWQGMDTYRSARWIVTSRIIGYSEVEVHQQLIKRQSSGRAVFTDTGMKVMADLMRRQGYPDKTITEMPRPTVSDMVESWHVIAHLAYTAPFAQPQIEQFALNWMRAMGDNDHDARRNAEAFIQGISNRPATQQLAPTPVFLTFMGLVFRRSRDFPNGRAELFRLIVLAYVESIEKDKFGSAALPAGLTVPVIEHLLDRVGWQAQLLRNRAAEEIDQASVLIPESTLSSWLDSELQNIIPLQDIPRTIKDLLRYLGERTGLIIPRGRLAMGEGQPAQEQYAFLHLSIQEFLAARWLHDRMTDDAWVERERGRPVPIDDLHDLNAPALPPDSLPSLRLCTRDPLWHEVFFLLHEHWQKPAPLFRLFAANPWLHAEHPQAVASLRDTILPQSDPPHGNNDQLTLLAAIALDDSNGLALHRTLRQQVLQALHGWCGRQWTQESKELSKLLHRRGSLAQASWSALLEELRSTSSTYLFLADASWLTPSALQEAMAAGPHLQRLYVNDCTGIADLAPLHGLSQLKSLHLTNCTSITDLAPLHGLSQLQGLYLNDCTGITDLAPLHGLSKLQRLDLSSCTGITDLSPLRGLSQLQVLHLANCTSITDLAPLKGLSQLQRLDLFYCMGITDLGFLQDLSQLQGLYLIGCMGITDLAPLNGLSQLQVLQLNECTGITDVAPLNGLSQLQVLDLTGCTGVTPDQVAGLKKALPKCRVLGMAAAESRAVGLAEHPTH